MMRLCKELRRGEKTGGTLRVSRGICVEVVIAANRDHAYLEGLDVSRSPSHKRSQIFQIVIETANHVMALPASTAHVG
jgi:hypothetical protein